MLSSKLVQRHGPQESVTPVAISAMRTRNTPNDLRQLNNLRSRCCSEERSHAGGHFFGDIPTVSGHSCRKHAGVAILKMLAKSFKLLFPGALQTESAARTVLQLQQPINQLHH